MLDPDGDHGISYRGLVRVAEARARGLDSGPMSAIKDRLERAWDEERGREAPVRNLVSLLLGHEPDTVERLLARALAEYTRRRRCEVSA